MDGERYHWRNGEDVVFDETYIHYAENRTSRARLILCCDIGRPVRTPLVRAYPWFVCCRVMKAAETENVPGEPVGALNRLFGDV